MRRFRVILSGYGRVGRAFAELLVQKQDILVERYHLSFQLVAVVDVDGAALAPQDSDLLAEGFLSALLPGKGPSSFVHYGRPGQTTPDLVSQGIADVLVEATPTNIGHGEPGMTNITCALERGMHVVTAAKGPLVVAFDRLRDLARENGVALKYSAATAAALPALDTGLYSLAGAEITKIEGVLNGTTNFILTRMQNYGESYQDALSEAQSRGIAETDPTLDVEGWDAANKLILISNAVLGSSLTLDSVDVSGITGVTVERLRAAHAAGKALKLIAQATVVGENGDTVDASVRLVELPLHHPLAHVSGAEKGVTFTTDTMDRVTVIGGKSDPRGAAAAILKDLINLSLERGPA